MALGAVLLSLPLAIAGAIYILAFHGFHVGLFIGAYVVLGMLAFASVMLIRSFRARRS